MSSLDIPVWGQISILGILVTIIGWIIFSILQGNLITGKRQDQIDANHRAELEAERERFQTELEAERARSRAWQEAWQAGQNLAAQQTETISLIASLAEVFQDFIQSLPKVPKIKVPDE